MSKIEAGRLTFNESAFDLHELVTELVELYGFRAKSKGLSLEITGLEDTPTTVSTDQGKLRQSLHNLIGNAVKFTRSGGVRITAGSEKNPDGTFRLRFAVADTGPGIDREELGNLFRPFVQSSAGHQSGGTGLGLALSKNYAGLMGGDITVESEPGKGAVFTLTIQAKPAAGASSDGYAKKTSPLRLSPGQAPVRILVADDIAINRDLLSGLLSPMGFDIRLAEDGAAAVKIFTEWNPSVVIMDMRMPVMDGYEANRRIKSLPGGRDTFILALTASAFEEDKTAVLASGADDFIRKPFQHDDLLARLAERLNLRYDYSDAAASVAARPPATDVDLSGIPEGILVDFRKACDEADFYALVALCETLADSDPAVASFLRSRVDAYAYEEISRLLSKT